MKIKLAIIGLGYVGLPLSIEFSKNRKVIGFDTDKKRINDLINNIDRSKEISKKILKNSKNLKFTTNVSDLNDCNCYIVTVPTPIFKKNKPNLNPLKKASQLIGNNLKKNDLVIYESTVYPGCTEEFCVPILEKNSGLKYNKDFYCGYSPERINPGDKNRSLEEIVKVTSGSTPYISKKISKLYSEIIKAGVYEVSSIKVAEAAKIIENTQRDLNIAFINELSILFQKLNIDTDEVLKAAETKWNFLSFRPGLVGGHCISVDPYYLTYKSLKVGYSPKIILAGRKINDQMALHASKKFINAAKQKKMILKKSKILFMGVSFKENCSDFRNSGSIKLLKLIKDDFYKIDIFDPYVDQLEFREKLELKLISSPKKKYYDGVIISVGHDLFKKIGIKKIISYLKPKNIIFDLKYIFPKKSSDIRL